MLEQRGYPDHVDTMLRCYERGIGDDLNGFSARAEAKSWDQALRWFRKTAAALIRDSVEVIGASAFLRLTF